jgi:MaoC like domain
MMKPITNTQTVAAVALALSSAGVAGEPAAAPTPKVPTEVRTDQKSIDFDPARFTVVPPRRFEDLRVGEVFRAPSRTMTDAHAAAFQTVSADNHPIHYDVEYARRHGHSAPVVHALQVFACTAPGCDPLSTIHRRRVCGVYEHFVSIPERGPCGGHALSPTRNH